MNVTLGLPFIRTSPDHGTAFDIAGKGIARPDSLIAALRLAARLVRPARERGRERRSTACRPCARWCADTAWSPKKALGQNFLFDLNLTGRIARAGRAARRASPWSRSGPGPGGLTRALLAEGAARVIAIERDPRALPALAEIAAHYPGRLEVVEADALTLRPARR